MPSDDAPTPAEPNGLSGPKHATGLKPVVGIFLTVFLDLLSFGMFIPDLQLRIKLLASQYYGVATESHDSRIGILVGLSLAAFSFAQLITAPFLGRLSDRIGRRKVLMFTSALSVASYVAYAHADSMSWIFLARILGGIGAGNLGVAFAYIADVTKPEERAKGLGLIGAAFGMGFILGPFTGAQLLIAGHNKPILLGYVAAALCLVNFIYIWMFLPESLSSRREDKDHFFADFKRAVSTPGLGLMLLMFFCVNLGFTNLETTYFQLLADNRSVFHLGDDAAKHIGGYILAFVGIIMALTQGLLVHRATDKFGELKLVRFSYLLLAPVLCLTPFAPLWIPALIGIVLLGVTNGLAQPNLSSLISRSSPRDIQGGIFGINQALGALARTIGPLISNLLFVYHPSFPYLLGGVLVLLPAIASWKLRQPAAMVEAKA